MIFKAVIFDLDGTLLDTLEDLASAANLTLRQFGFPEHPVNAYKIFVGEGVMMLARRCLPPEARQDVIIARWVAAYLSIYNNEARPEKTRPYEGIPELLDALTACGLKMAILSNKPHAVTPHLVARLLPRWQFNPIIGAGSLFPLKPDPAGALEIAHLLTLPPDQCLYLGDTQTDMETARRAGMFAVGVLWGFRDAKELKASGARMLLAKPFDLLNLL